MKRPLKITGGVILLLLSGACAWFFLKSPSPPRAPLSSPDLAPSNSALFLWLPRVPQTLARFKETPIYAKLREQSLQAGPLQDPIATFWSHFQGEAFLAFASGGEGIGGFQTTENPGNFTVWMDRLKIAFPELKWREKNHASLSYSVAESGQTVFCTAQWKNWIFLGCGEPAFQKLLDRVLAENPDPTAGLSGQAAFKSFLSRQSPDFDALTYMNPWGLEKTNSPATETKAPPPPGPILLTSLIEGPHVRNRWSLQALSEESTETPPPTAITARFTTPKTLATQTQILDFNKSLSRLRETDLGQKQMIEQGFVRLNQVLAPLDLDLETLLLPKFGPEFSLILDWDPTRRFPDPALVLEHRDEATVRKLFDFLAQKNESSGTAPLRTRRGEISGKPAYFWDLPPPMPTPALWVGGDVILLTLNEANLEAMVKRSIPNPPPTAPSQASVNAPESPPLPDPESLRNDANLILQDLIDLDEAVSAWAKEKNRPAGSVIAWNDIVPYLPEGSQVGLRVGLDPFGNAYVLGKTGPRQVQLAPATQQRFEGSVTPTFWGKFAGKAAR